MASLLRRTLTGLKSRARGPGSVTLVTTLAAQLMALITGVIAARALGVDHRGTLALLWLLPNTLVLIGGLGIPQAATYYLARESEHSRPIVLMTATVTAGLTLALVPICGIALYLFSGAGHDFSLLAGVFSVALVPVILAQNLGVAILLGQERFGSFNLTRISPATLYAVVSGVIFVAGFASLTSIIAGALAAWAAGAVFTWVVIFRKLASADTEPEVTRGEIVSFGVRGVIGSVSPVDDIRLDQFMVGLLLDARALGLYVAAIAFCNLPRFVALSIGAVAYPRIAAAKLSPAAWSMVRRYFKLGLGAISATVLILLLIVPSILPVLFGSDFQDAVGLSRILLFAALFLALHRLLIELARGLGHPGYGSITEIVNTVVLLVGVLLVVQASSVEAVAWCVAAGGVVASSLLLGLIIRLRRKSDVEPVQALSDR